LYAVCANIKAVFSINTFLNKPYTGKFIKITIAPHTYSKFYSPKFVMVLLSVR